MNLEQLTETLIDIESVTGNEQEILNFIEDYLELYLPIQSSMGFHPNEPNYLKDIRFVLTLDYQNLARLFTRRWF